MRVEANLKGQKVGKPLLLSFFTLLRGWMVSLVVLTTRNSTTTHFYASTGHPKIVLSPDFVWYDILMMEKLIFICRKCNKKYSAPPSQTAKYKCPTCGSILEQFQQPSTQQSASSQESLIGKKLGGCQILERLGGGAMGEVYKAKH